MGTTSTSLLPLSEERLRTALDGLIEGVNIFDRDLRYVYVNAAAAAQGRRSIDSLVGQRMYDLYPGVEHSDFYKTLERIAAGAPACHIETPFEFPDGSVGYFKLSLEPMVGGGVFLLSMETTAQVQAEHALSVSESRHRALLSGLPDLIFLLEPNGVVLDLYAPPTVPLLRPREEILGQPLTDSLPPELGSATTDALARVIATRQPVTMPYELALPSGVRRFEATMVLRDDERLTVIIHDVTERVSLEEQLRQAQKMEAIGQLTGGIAHDFNNLLTVISSNAGLLAEYADEAGQPVALEVQEITRAARRGADMVSQLLQFSRRGVLRRQLVDPAVALLRSTTMLRRLLPETVQIRMGELPMGYILSLDTGALEQIMANLCTNARDAMPKGGTISITSDTETLDPHFREVHPWLDVGEYFRITVRDTGLGMNEESLRRIFEPFYTTKPLGTGTGLGMAMVYGLMKSHHGMVEVSSAPGAGTSVSLHFPIVAGAVATEVHDAISQPPVAPGGHEGILIVEDDAAIRNATRRALEAKGYRVWLAADGAEGMAMYGAHANEVALILSDLVMPHMTGREMAGALRASGASVPILFASGYSADWIYGDTDLPNDIHFLPKPWTLTTLFLRVREVIDSAGQLTH